MPKKKTPKSPATTPKQKGRVSPVEAHVALLGTMPDAEVAKVAGTTAKAVAQYRIKRKIAGFGRGPADALPAEKGEAPQDGAPVTVAAAPEAAVAAAAATPKKGSPAKKTTAQKAPAAKKTPAKRAPPAKKTPAKKAPAQKAKAKKAAAPKKAPAATKAAPKKRAASANRGKPRGWAEKLLLANRALLGILGDQGVSDRLGMSAEAVRQHRRKHGIPSASVGGPVAGKKGAAKKAPAKAPAKAAKTTPASAKAAAASKKTPPASAKASPPKRVAALVQPSGTTSTCWRVSVRDGEPVHVVADTLAAAATRVDKALGAAAIGIERVGPAIG